MLATMNNPHPPHESLGPSSSDAPPLADNSHQNTPVPVLGAPRRDESSVTASVVGPPLSQQHLRPAKPPRVWLPVLLLLATCLSTFWAGAMSWEPLLKFSQSQWQFDVGIRIRQEILRYAGQGVTYMVSVIAILFTHEMGHYVATRIYRIPASLPYFIPFPFAPFGTMGAVIGMQGHRANRREIFDIGLAGPLVGLVVAVPILWIGISRLDLTQPVHGAFRFELPLLAQWIYAYLHPGQPAVREMSASQFNALSMAGWVGLLITGLNMLPVSQLDGGHIIYTLFGRWSRWIARSFVLVAVVYMAWTRVLIWALMLIIVLVIGIDHPRTADDTVKLGWLRTLMGLVSLLIPVLCFPPRGLMLVGP